MYPVLLLAGLVSAISEAKTHVEGRVMVDCALIVDVIFIFKKTKTKDYISAAYFYQMQKNDVLHLC